VRAIEGQGLRFTVAMAAMLLMVAVQSASAGLIAYDGFETYTADTALGGQNNGTWGGAWSAASGIYVRAAALSYSSGTVQISGGSNVAQVEDAVNVDAATARLLPASQSGTLYISFLFRVAAGQESSDFMQFALNNDTSIANSGSIGDLSTSDSKLGARIGGSNGGSTTGSTTNVSGGTTYLLVGRMKKSSSASPGDPTGVNYDRMDLLINPSSLTEPADGSWSATRVGTASISSIAYFTLRTAGLDVGDRYQFDELRIGDTFASVVPEPATMTLLGAGLLLLARRRR